MSIEVTRQITVHLLAREGRRRVALWTEFVYRGERRHELFVLEAVPTLLPRGRIGQRFISSARNVDALQLTSWLLGEGYRIVATCDSGAGPPSYRE